MYWHLNTRSEISVRSQNRLSVLSSVQQNMSKRMSVVITYTTRRGRTEKHTSVVDFRVTERLQNSKRAAWCSGFSVEATWAELTFVKDLVSSEAEEASGGTPAVQGGWKRRLRDVQVDGKKGNAEQQQHTLPPLPHHSADRHTLCSCLTPKHTHTHTAARA